MPRRSNTDHSRQEPCETIRIDGRLYRVVQRLSLPGRGRWLVRDSQPKPRGTLRTAIVLADTPEARQLERSLRRLPRDVAGLPCLHACGWYGAKRVWIVSWLHGLELDQYLQRAHEGKYQRPSVWETVKRMKSLAHLLRILHQRCGIVHGDVNPRNLIVGRGALGLFDFGSSWQSEIATKRAYGDGFVASYAAPELIQSQYVDSRTDQFSAAVVMYEMLTMQLPYSGLGGRAGLPENRLEVEGDYVPPSRLIADSCSVPRSILGGIDTVLGRALKLDIDCRYPTPTHFCEALDELHKMLLCARDFRRNSQHLLASQDSQIGRFKKWLVRMLEG